jgi:hypothetical protein
MGFIMTFFSIYIMYFDHIHDSLHHAFFIPSPVLLSCDGKDREVRDALLSKGPKVSFGSDIYVHYLDRLQ